jgi:hypothetical protein
MSASAMRDAEARCSSRWSASMLMRRMPPPGISGAAGTLRAPRRTGRRAAWPLVGITAVAIGTSGACDRADSPDGYSGTPIVIGDTLLRFADGSEYISGFRNVEYIGTIPARTRAPFIIIAGHECRDCDAPPSVLVRSPSDGPVRELSGLPGWHPYPGRVIAYGDDSAVVSHSRLFWGNCLPERPPGLIEFRSEFAGDGSEPAREVRISEIDGDSLIGWRRVATTRLLATTLVQVQAKECREIPQRDIPAPP